MSYWEERIQDIIMYSEIPLSTITNILITIEPLITKYTFTKVEWMDIVEYTALSIKPDYSQDEIKQAVLDNINKFTNASGLDDYCNKIK